MTFTSLRQQYPQFVYDSFDSKITADGLKITHHFIAEPDIEFHPTVTIQGVTAKQWTAIPPELRETWVFHLGLAEIPSYWKATASPEIVIKAGYLNPDQIAWWQDLLIKGMGEYFYINQIDFTSENFVSWTVTAPKQTLTGELNYPPTKPEYLIPIGGGKDSTLSLCLLNQQQIDYDTFLLNPTPAMEQISALSQPRQNRIARRIIDPTLLELNQKGYLNGHVPFSAYLGFLSRFTALIFGNETVAISNERSSNEGNVVFHDTLVNHQYSKTYEFELGFDQYLKKNHLISPTQSSPAYFSLLRPLYELQISRLFLNCPVFDKYATFFRSCNRGQKTNTWCGECSKCLFAFITFYPFLTTEKITQIFGQNLFDNESLLDEALALLGKSATKPFDCVGTHEESTAAFYLAVKKHQADKTKLPTLLQLVWDQVLSKQDHLDERATAILQGWNQDHQLPGRMKTLLQDAIKNLK